MDDTTTNEDYFKGLSPPPSDLDSEQEDGDPYSKYSEDLCTKDDDVTFIKFIELNKVLLEKSNTPTIRDAKQKAFSDISIYFNKGKLSVEQVKKKLQNIKNKLKQETDVNRTGNRPIKLNEAQKLLEKLMNKNVENENPILNRIPGAQSAGVSGSRPMEQESKLKRKFKPPPLVKKQNPDGPLKQETILDIQFETLKKQMVAMDVEMKKNNIELELAEIKKEFFSNGITAFKKIVETCNEIIHKNNTATTNPNNYYPNNHNQSSYHNSFIQNEGNYLGQDNSWSSPTSSYYANQNQEQNNYNTVQENNDRLYRNL